MVGAKAFIKEREASRSNERLASQRGVTTEKSILTRLVEGGSNSQNPYLSSTDIRTFSTTIKHNRDGQDGYEVR